MRILQRQKAKDENTGKINIFFSNEINFKWVSFVDGYFVNKSLVLSDTNITHTK
jgi:hypothetical protein